MINVYHAGSFVYEEVLPFGNDKQNFAKSAIENGTFEYLYSLVAKVDGFDLEWAFELTNNTDHNWTANFGLCVVGVAIGHPIRSTSIGDVMEMDGKFYIVDSVGFIEV